ncbi:protein LSM12 [Penaeus vannamei]|uniref:Uncharacterized protein n=1 Tax=Penaeus vannamei TaxID=6689 RepID=A0A3R7PHP8_PENVA|nr:protein LSM12 homolog [Penaeus vannamei]XP_037772586.1 protein LSM12 homolog [Penaeus monodon]ROT66860.1 putative protein LSM12-like [Penaeus vannamei]
MADSSECFNIGSTVSCVTCFDEELQGEVLAFDSHVKLLTLKSPASSGRTSLCDIRMVNLSYVSQVTVLREAPVSSLPTLPSLNLTKLNSRAKRSIEEKQRLIQAMQSGVSPDGQKLFLTINKTLEEVTWKGVNILVMGQVLITPPYQSDNVREHKDGKEVSALQLNYIKKIVDKFHKDQQSMSMNNGTSATPVVEVQAVSQ